MKIVITHDNLIRNQYGEGYIEVQARELDKITDSFADEIICDGPIDFLVYQQRQAFLGILVKKIRYGGTLILSGNDIFEVARLTYSGQINEEQFCNVCLSGRVSIASIHNVERILTALNMKIINKRLNNLRFTIICQRIKP